jgi:DNA-directed RNA polymerase subunit beta
MVQSLRRSKSFRILFNSPELVEEQRSGFHHFLKHGIAEELSKISFLEVKRQNVDIEVFLDANSFQLIAPEDNSRDCVIKMKTYACKLYVQIRIVWKKKSGDILMQTEPEWVLLAHLPMMTKRGHFVINGSPRVIVHQVVRAPGVYFQKFGKVKKDERNKARFYGDIIPRKGVWVRLQISKTGQVEIKLKKSTKVQAEMVERCLAVIEKQELSKGLTLSRSESVAPQNAFGSKHGLLDANQPELTSSGAPKVTGTPFQQLNFREAKVRIAELSKQHQVDQSLAWIYKAFGLLVGCFADFTAPSAGSDRTFENFATLRNSNEARVRDCLPERTFGKQSRSCSASLSKRKFKLELPWLDPSSPSKSAAKRNVVPGMRSSDAQSVLTLRANKIKEGASAKAQATRKLACSEKLSKQPNKFNQNYCSRSQFMAITGISKPFLELGALRNRAITSSSRSDQKILQSNSLGCYATKASTKSGLPERSSDFRQRGLRESLLDSQSKATDGKCYDGGVHGLQSRTFVVRPRTTNVERGIGSKRRPIELGSLSRSESARSSSNRSLGKKGVLSEPVDNLKSTETRDLREGLSPLSSRLRRHSRDDLENGVANTNYGTTIRQSRTRKDLSERFAKAELKGDDRAFTNVYDNLYRVPEMKELEDKMYPKGSSIPIDTEFKRDFSYKHIFATFKAPWRYSLGTVGRHKLNKKFGLDLYDNQLTSKDLQAARNWLYRLRDGKEIIDDIDHFQNRRVRQSGELIQNQFENGVTRLRKLVRRKLRTPTFESLPFGLPRELSRSESYQKILPSTTFYRSPVELSRKALAGPLAERRFVFDETGKTGALETGGFVKLTRAVGASLPPSDRAELLLRSAKSQATRALRKVKFEQEGANQGNSSSSRVLLPAYSNSSIAGVRALQSELSSGVEPRQPEVRFGEAPGQPEVPPKGVLSEAFIDPCSAKFSEPIKKSSLFSRANLWKIRESLCFYTRDKVQQIPQWQLRINSRRTPFHYFIPRLLLTDCRGRLSQAWAQNLIDLKFNGGDRAVSQLFATKKRLWTSPSFGSVQSTRTVLEKHERFSILCTIERSVNKSVPVASFAFVKPTHSSLVLAGLTFASRKCAKCTKGQLLLVFSKGEQEGKYESERRRISLGGEVTQLGAQAPLELSLTEPIRCRMVWRSHRNVPPGPGLSHRLSKNSLTLRSTTQRTKLAVLNNQKPQKIEDFGRSKKDATLESEGVSPKRAQVVGEVVLPPFGGNRNVVPAKTARLGFSKSESRPTRFAKPISLKKDSFPVNRTFKQASELFSTKPINGALREFFGSNPLSQYMDQTNPLAELTHKRRISSLGIGGVSRESAGMAIRGIHPTHYGRICPIETPEGKNAGLVNSLAIYARLNKHGFIETPYYKVIKGQVQEELGFSFYSALKETADHLHLAPSDLQQSQANMLGVLGALRSRANAVNKMPNFRGAKVQVSLETRQEPVGSGGFLSTTTAPSADGARAGTEFRLPPRGVQLADDFVQANSGCLVPVRVSDTLLDVFKKVTPYEVDCIGISPVQILSVATSLIPFLEHNDANRALMGSNMQRQAVPLMISERPIVGTGLETLIAAESGQTIQSSISGLVSHVSANKIIIERLFNTGAKNNSDQLSNVFSRTVSDRPISTQKLGPLLFRGAEHAKRNILAPRTTFVKAKLSFAETKPRKLHYLMRSRQNNSLLCLQWTTPQIWLDSILSTSAFDRNSVPITVHFRETKVSAYPEVEQEGSNHGRPPAAQLKLSSGRASRNQKSVLSPGYRALCTQTLLRKATCFCVSKSKKPKNRVLFSELSQLYKNRPQQSGHKLSVFGSLSAADPILLNVRVSTGLNSRRELPELRSGYPPKGGYSKLLLGVTPLLASATQKQVVSLRNIARARGNRTPSFRFAETCSQMTLLPFVHSLRSFSRSNQETCLTQKPLVQEGEWVQKGDILTDCSASEKGELAVGKNVMIAYLPWEGYNFEDAIVVSDRLTKEQIYASLHIERYVCEAQDIKEKITNSNEWFTRNLPGVHPKLVSHLDTFGFPKIGTILKEGDILVGKMRYFRNKPTTPYEKLLSDILGDGHFSVSLTSLRVPKGVHEARVISHRVVKTFRSSLESTFTGVSRPAGTPKMVHIFLGEKRSIQIGDKMSGRHGNKGIISTILPKQDMPYLPDGSPIDILLNPLGVPSRMNVGQIFESLLGLASTYLNQNFKITAFDELYGVEASQSLVYLKLYQARLQSGQNWLFQINFPGKTRLIDGRSGECFDQWVTVGRAYMLKLIHMVNEKIHARNTGPYALITQQPLRGRSQKGGQRLGEMEVWALEGYGAAYILQELLTKKSDDFAGRQEIINSLVVRSDKFSSPDNPYRDYSNPDDPYQRFSDPENPYQVIQETRLVLGHPEIFKTLICELQALCLDVGVYALKKESFQREYLGIVN